MDDCVVQRVPCLECNAPDDSFAFKIINRTAIGSDYLYCYVQSEELRQFFALVSRYLYRCYLVLDEVIYVLVLLFPGVAVSSATNEYQTRPKSPS